MKAEIITYKTEGMNNSQRSIISKRLFGYIDRTKKSAYTYKRTGALEEIKHVVITKKTFIVSTDNAEEIRRIIRKLGAQIKTWTIQISADELKKRYG